MTPLPSSTKLIFFVGCALLWTCLRFPSLVDYNLGRELLEFSTVIMVHVSRLPLLIAQMSIDLTGLKKALYKIQKLSRISFRYD